MQTNLHSWHPCTTCTPNLTSQSTAYLQGSLSCYTWQQCIIHWAIGLHLDKHFANECGSKKVPEGHEEVAAADAAQVKGSIGPSSQQQDAIEAMPAQHMQICIESQSQQQRTAKQFGATVPYQGSPQAWLMCRRHKPCLRETSLVGPMSGSSAKCSDQVGICKGRRGEGG